ncbi:hypothetical protein GGD61_001975 [Bradyrhizobium sp. SBR1B]|nr:hypothetical protein [Bradyrhizobium sp. SBR1B]
MHSIVLTRLRLKHRGFRLLGHPQPVVSIRVELAYLNRGAGPEGHPAIIAALPWFVRLG